MLHSLYADHRSIQTVLHAMQQVADLERAATPAGRVEVLRAALRYLDVFGEGQHHPREEHFLFPAIRAHTREADEALGQIGIQHASGEAAVQGLARQLARYESRGESEWALLARAVHDFVAKYEAHIRLEEDVVMPIAARVVTADEWSRVDATIARLRDPEGSQEPEQLLQQIAMLASADGARNTAA